MSGKFDDGAAWEKLLSVHAQMLSGLEELLQTQYHISHGEFEVLLRLAWAGDHRLRIRDLADASALTRSGMSRLVDRLELAGLLRRETAREDARGAYAILTPAGQARQEKAEASTMAFVRQTFLSLYTQPELKQMVEYWTRFLNRAEAKPGARG